MKEWLTGIAKRKVILETWQGEMIRGNAGLDKWQRKIQDIKNELEGLNRQVRMLTEEKRGREAMLAGKEGEVNKLREKIMAMEMELGKQCDPESGNVKDVGRFDLAPLLPGLEDLRGSDR